MAAGVPAVPSGRYGIVLDHEKRLDWESVHKVCRTKPPKRSMTESWESKEKRSNQESVHRSMKPETGLENRADRETGLRAGADRKRLKLA